MLGMSNKSSVLAVIYVNIALYALCFQMQRPLEPFLVQQIGKEGGESGGMGAEEAAAQYTNLQSFFSIVQVVGSLLSGPLLDRFGAKGGFFINFLCSAASYYLLSISTNMEILYYSKIPTVFQAGYLCGQLAISQITQEGQERTGALGALTTAYLVGNFIGPALGGVLGADGDYFYGARLATIGSLLSCCLVLLMPLSEATADFRKKNNSSNGDGDDKKKKAAGAATGGYQLVLQAVWLLLLTKLVSGFANSLTSAVMPLILKNEYNLNEKQLGYSMSFMPLINGAMGLALSSIIAYVGGNLSAITICLTSSTTINCATAVLTHPSVAAMIPALAAGSSSALTTYLAMQMLLSVPQFVLAATITSDSTGRVSQNLQGTLLGLEHGLFAAVRIATPTLGATILNQGGVTAVSATCALIYFSIAALFAVNRGSLPQQHQQRGEDNKKHGSTDSRKSEEEHKKK